MSQANFIIGRGEMLTEVVKGPKGGRTLPPVYSYSEALRKLEPMVERTTASIEQLPAKACPSDFAVAKLTLHPAYIAKSYFPTSLLRASELVSVGSRNTFITPAKWRKKGGPFPWLSPRKGQPLPKTISARHAAGLSGQDEVDACHWLPKDLRDNTVLYEQVLVQGNGYKLTLLSLDESGCEEDDEAEASERSAYDPRFR